MGKYNGAVFFDVDGTLIDERFAIYHPTARVKKAIMDLKNNGYLIGVSTGRARCYVPDIDINFDCYISCNGAVAEVDGKEIHNDYIDEKLVKKLIEYMDAENIGYALETSSACYYQIRAKEEFDALIKLFNMKASSFRPFVTSENIKTNKMLITFQKIEQYEKMRSKFQNEISVLQHHRNFSADIIKKNMSKAVGVGAVIKYLGIDIKDTYAFGDDFNDEEMLGAVAHGVAMTPHAKVLDDVAEYITGGVNEDGVYTGLKHYGLVD